MYWLLHIIFLFISISFFFLGYCQLTKTPIFIQLSNQSFNHPKVLKEDSKLKYFILRNLSYNETLRISYFKKMSLGKICKSKSNPNKSHFSQPLDNNYTASKLLYKDMGKEATRAY